MGPEVAIKDQGGIAKFLNYCLYEMLKMQRFDDDDDDGAPAQDLAILDHLVLALRGHIQVGAQLTCFFLIAKVDLI